MTSQLAPLASRLGHYARLFARRAYREAHSVRSQYPTLYFPIEQLLHPDRRHICVSPQHDLVIEGYPRSSNSFTVAAFHQAQTKNFRVAHHLHAPAQIIRACKLGIPCLVLVRRPRDAVLSCWIHTPEWSLAFLIRDYIRFYKSILPYSDGFVVATLEQTTTDLGSVIRRLNTKFESNFELFDHTDDNSNQVFRSMEEKHMKRLGRIDNKRISRPTIERNSLKADLISQLENPRLSKALRRADYLFESLCSLSA